MKKLIYFILLFTLTLGFLSIVNAEEYSEKHKQIISYLLSGKEPSVKDACWLSNSSLYIGVYNLGYRKDGLAQYFCLVVRQDFNFHGRLYIQIVDIQKIWAKKGFVKLGECFCP
jgi:hypothetical protein